MGCNCKKTQTKQPTKIMSRGTNPLYNGSNTSNRPVSGRIAKRIIR